MDILPTLAVAPVCAGQITGFGRPSYRLGQEAMNNWPGTHAFSYPVKQHTPGNPSQGV